MTINPEIFFYLFGVLTIAPAVAIIFTRTLMNAALLLIFCFLGIAGLFVLMQAEFIAVTQIVVYAGGILILIIFGVMLTPKVSGGNKIRNNENIFAGLLVLSGWAVLLAALLKGYQGQPVLQGQQSGNEIKNVGILLMSDNLMAFELSAVLLLAALVGAAMIASNFKRETE